MVRKGKAVPLRAIGSSVVGRAGHVDLVAAESMASAPPAPPVTAPAAFPNGAETGGAAARRYHLVHGSKVPYTDLSAVRPSAKSYPDAELLPLPYPPRARTGFSAERPEGLGDLLALAYGVTRIDWSAKGIRAGRPLPSGGGVYPGELYVAAEFGLCHYLPSAHALERLHEVDPDRGVVEDVVESIVDCLASPPEERPKLVLVLTTRHAANLAGFGSFGHRLQALDTGVTAGQALALLEAAGARARVHSQFDEARLGRVLGLEPAAESVRAVITAGPGLDEPTAVPAFSTDPGASQAGLPRRIMARHTARDGFEPVSVPLQRILELLEDAALPLPTDVRIGRGAQFAELELYCLAKRVDGLAAGCHRRNPANGGLEPAGEKADPRTLFQSGGRGELAHFQAACALFVAGDYEHGYRVHGDRWYRMLNLHAGILAQRIGIAAAGLGLGSSVRCDYQVKAADRLINAPSDRTVLLTVLIGVERGAGAPGHRLLLGSHGS